jgi:hypothetical protein
MAQQLVMHANAGFQYPLTGDESWMAYDYTPSRMWTMARSEVDSIARPTLQVPLYIGSSIDSWRTAIETYYMYTFGCSTPAPLAWPLCKAGGRKDNGQRMTGRPKGSGQDKARAFRLMGTGPNVQWSWTSHRRNHLGKRKPRMVSCFSSPLAFQNIHF